MADDICTEIEQHRESWIMSWLKWCPTSLNLLREAEKSILSNLQNSYKGRYVNVGPTVGKKDLHIWTISLNEESPNTPMVLLHGFASGLGLWCLNIDSFAAKRPVYALDIVGFGRSSRPNFTSEPLEAEREFIATIESWRHKMGLEKFILLGHSFGGFLATSYAVKHPERVSHLVLADPWGFPERPLDVAERYNLPFWVRAVAALLRPFNPLFIIRTAGPLGPGILKKARPDLVRKFSGLVPDADVTIPSYLYHCNAQTPSGESAFHSLMSDFGWAKYPMIQRMDSMRKEVPITLIYGARSWVDRDPGFQIKYMRQDSYVNVQILQGAGHHVYADRSEDFNQLVNLVGGYCDTMTLPELAPAESARDLSGHFNLTEMINVRNENIHDEEELEEGKKIRSKRNSLRAAAKVPSEEIMEELD